MAHNGGAGADGTDTITNVEFLEFTDQTIDLSTWPTLTATTTPTTTGAQGASGSGSPYSSGSSSSSISGTFASADVSTQAGATAASAITNNMLERMSSQLALMGALQSRLAALLMPICHQKWQNLRNQ